MSLKQDIERANEARKEAIERARELTRIEDRVIDMFEDWLSDREIAESLGCHKRTVLRYRKHLRLAAFKLARKEDSP